jgi:hypothetical protein
MKKILMSSAVLLLFSVSLIIFQMSCQKSSIAQSSTQTSNKILLKKDIERQVGTTVDSSGKSIPVYRYSVDFYVVQYDGTNLSKINIVMPSGEYPWGNGSISPDGEKLIFNALNINNHHSVYSCFLNGSNLIKLVDGSYQVQGAY